ncbi:hypothetical protein PVAP13_1KG399500 [Panicum virgatum]|uniref:Uncharacterized protein n=1 Tax=Panicum virgatum TaxID=38727 RepID=A0A8T0XL36_PANVG|nr:hypothetical protein PVAP13_1KG399500 [Panicum virgatum]
MRKDEIIPVYSILSLLPFPWEKRIGFFLHRSSLHEPLLCSLRPAVRRQALFRRFSKARSRLAPARRSGAASGWAREARGPPRRLDGGRRGHQGQVACARGRARSHAYGALGAGGTTVEPVTAGGHCALGGTTATASASTSSPPAAARSAVSSCPSSM